MPKAYTSTNREETLTFSSFLKFKLYESMESESLLPKPTYGGIKRYLSRRRYQRLDGGATGGKKTKMVRLRRSPRRHFRIKAVPRLTWAVRSPLKMLAKLKNAYTNFMLRSMNTDNIFGEKKVPKADPVVSNGLYR
ncbi:hypothetical protein E2542_SST07673 [Spatholobus suberectus]|nr:hypothetical protein E2542_SST07673 [Spatholobus suberectus]